MTDIRIDTDIQGLDEAAVGEERKRLAKRLRTATEAVGRAVLLEPTRAITEQALGPRVARAWDWNLYPVAGAQAETSLKPAFFMFSKAPVIVRAHTEGATIRPKNGKRYLAIPTDNVPLGRGGRRLRPDELARQFGELIVVRAESGKLYLVGQGARGKRGKTHRFYRPGAYTARSRGLEEETFVLYELVRQVTLRQRFDLEPVFSKAREAFPTEIARALSTRSAR